MVRRETTMAGLDPWDCPLLLVRMVTCPPCIGVASPEVWGAPTGKVVFRGVKWVFWTKNRVKMAKNKVKIA